MSNNFESLIIWLSILNLNATIWMSICKWQQSECPTWWSRPTGPGTIVLSWLSPVPSGHEGRLWRPTCPWNSLGIQEWLGLHSVGTGVRAIHRRGAVLKNVLYATSTATTRQFFFFYIALFSSSVELTNLTVLNSLYEENASIKLWTVKQHTQPTHDSILWVPSIHPSIHPSIFQPISSLIQPIFFSRSQRRPNPGARAPLWTISSNPTHLKCMVSWRFIWHRWIIRL